MKKMSIARMVSCGLLLSLVSLPAFALRCGNAVISIGDPKVKVQHYCGNPASKSSAEVERIHGFNSQTGQHFENRVTVTKEQWTYNFGSQNFLYTITFDGEDNVEKITTGDYGY